MKRTPIKAFNVERRRESHALCFDGGIDHDAWIRNRPCLICEASGRAQTSRTEAAHVIARGMGSAKGRWYDLIPLCQEHHSEHGKIGTPGIEARYKLNLANMSKWFTGVHMKEMGIIS